LQQDFPVRNLLVVSIPSADKTAIRPQGGPGRQPFLDVFENDGSDNCVDQSVVMRFCLEPHPGYGLVRLDTLRHLRRPDAKPVSKYGMFIGTKEIDRVSVETRH
jgi:hypothetical protein